MVDERIVVIVVIVTIVKERDYQMRHYIAMWEETEAEENKGRDGWTMLEINSLVEWRLTVRYFCAVGCCDWNQIWAPADDNCRGRIAVDINYVGIGTYHSQL